MKRKDTLKELLEVIFGGTTVKPAGGKIYKSGNLFSSCKYNDTDRDTYIDLLQITYLDDATKQQSPSFDPDIFNKKESISCFFNYLRSYREALFLPDVDAPSSSIFAFEAAVTIITAIFSPPSESDKFKIEDEDISIAFRKALDRIEKIEHSVDPEDVVNSFSNERTIFYDNDYSTDKSKCSYSVLVETRDIVSKLRDRYDAILLGIYIDKSKKYNNQSSFFYNELISTLYLDNIRHTETQDELFIVKPLSLRAVSISVPDLWTYKTYLDEKIVLTEYKCNDKYSLNNKIIAKAKKQYAEYIDKLKPEWDINILNYTGDIIKRVMSLDLLWLYNDANKESGKCREEVEKIIVGYPEIYSYLDSCSDETQSKQLTIILHHAVKEITAFINNRCRFISEYVISQEFSDHKKYVKGIVNGNKFKELKTFSKGMNSEDSSEPQSLFDEYYYTSGNELPQLIFSLQSYYEALKKVHKES